MKILVLSSHTHSLFWFRMDMMKSFIEKGYEVCAVGNEQEDKWKEQFKQNKINYYSIPVSRNGLNFLSDLKTFKALREIIKREKPNKIFVYQAKTIVYGSLAARSVNSQIGIYPLIAGLGSIFRGKGIKNKLIKTILGFQYRLVFEFAKKIIFQNEDDLNTLVKLSIVSPYKTCIINGSGVDINRFKRHPLPRKKSILYIGRLIGDKGVREYLEVCKKLKEKDNTIECLLVGPYDTNPSALTPDEIKPFIENEIIKYYGEQKDVIPFLQDCKVFVLPSYHEGTPKTVLEAMAIGRPIVTTDAPGCRETVIDNQNGYLVPVKDTKSLESAILKILYDDNLATRMAEESRKIAESKYDVNIVNNDIMKILRL